MRAVREHHRYSGKRRPVWKRVVLVLLTVGILCFGALEAVIFAGGRTQIVGQPDVMVILGCQIKTTGPSELLKDRLDTALEYLNGLPVQIPVVVSGGQGRDEPMTEAEGMADYLVEAGYPVELIWLEGDSHNTAENLRFTARKLEERSIDPANTEILVVSNGFHLTRARMLAERIGYQTVSTLAAPSSHIPSRLKMYIREPLALVKSFLFDS